MSYHLTAFELTNQLLCMNFPGLERQLFQKDLMCCRRLLRCDFVTSVPSGKQKRFTFLYLVVHNNSLQCRQLTFLEFYFETEAKVDFPSACI